MDILVCIKQVPASNKVEVDPVTGVLLRNGADSKMNPYDLYALETALKIREEVGGTISVISMGPPQAMTVIREAFAMGVDRGALLSDRRFGGADVLATVKVLSEYQGDKEVAAICDAAILAVLANPLVLSVFWQIARASVDSHSIERLDTHREGTIVFRFMIMDTKE